MELKISKIGDKGVLTNERIGFNVLRKCQLKYFLVIKTHEVNSTTFFHISDAAYWFLPQEVNENDKIVLYTKQGNNSIKENPDGTKTYFFYWGLSEPIFKTVTDRIVLVNTNTWKMNE